MDPYAIAASGPQHLGSKSLWSDMGPAPCQMAGKSMVSLEKMKFPPPEISGVRIPDPYLVVFGTHLVAGRCKFSIFWKEGLEGENCDWKKFN